MNFVYAVPKDAKLHVVTGMDDLEPQHEEVDHAEALKQANKWNYGGYHCDMWMDICYRSDDDRFWGDEGMVRCDLLYDVKSNKVIGFLYSSSSETIVHEEEGKITIDADELSIHAQGTVKAGIDRQRYRASPIVLTNGDILSVQAGKSLCSTPQKDFAGSYSHVEVYTRLDVFNEWRCDGVYQYVPIEKVVEYINSIGVVDHLCEMDVLEYERKNKQ